MKEKMTDEEYECRLRFYRDLRRLVPGGMHGCFEEVFRYQFLEECRKWSQYGNGPVNLIEQ